jgi:hypothetical protein
MDVNSRFGFFQIQPNIDAVSRKTRQHPGLQADIQNGCQQLQIKFPTRIFREMSSFSIERAVTQVPRQNQELLP